MLADELATFAQWFDWALHIDGVIRQLPAALAAIREQHAESAVDVEDTISTRRASVNR